MKRLLLALGVAALAGCGGPNLPDILLAPWA